MCPWNAVMHGNGVIFKIQCVFVLTVINKKIRKVHETCTVCFLMDLARPNRQRHVRV